jgi:hypothetical protein
VIDLTGAEVSEAGTPPAVAGIFLWLITHQRRRLVSVCVKDERICPVDAESMQPIDVPAEGPFGGRMPKEMADPTRFVDRAEINQFFEAFREATGPRGMRRRCETAIEFAPPRIPVLVERHDAAPNSLRLRLQ